MYACICNAVTDDEVTDAVHAGAETGDEVGDVTLAGTTCGGCHSTLESLIRSCKTCPLAALVA